MTWLLMLTMVSFSRPPPPQSNLDSRWCQMGAFFSFYCITSPFLLLLLRNPASRLKAMLWERRLVYPRLCLTNHFHYKSSRNQHGNQGQPVAFKLKVLSGCWAHTIQWKKNAQKPASRCPVPTKAAHNHCCLCRLLTKWLAFCSCCISKQCDLARVSTHVCVSYLCVWRRVQRRWRQRRWWNISRRLPGEGRLS